MDILELNKAYLELVEAVRKFDIEAVEYLLGSGIRNLRSFMLRNGLGGAFAWGESKQGHECWQGIQGKLKEVGYYE